MNLRLTIEGLDDGDDMALAVTKVAAQLSEGRTGAAVYDANGNRVGEWELT